MVAVPPRLTKRHDDNTNLNLLNNEEFEWMLPNGHEIGARLKVEMPGEDEFILSTTRFRGMTKWMSCSRGGKAITIAFNNNETFDYAKKTWDWVNGANNRSFIMVAEPWDCPWNVHRVPFIVKTLRFNGAENVAYLESELSDWATTAPIHDLIVGFVPGKEHDMPEPHQLRHAKRGIRRVFAGGPSLARGEYGEHVFAAHSMHKRLLDDLKKAFKKVKDKAKEALEGVKEKAEEVKKEVLDRLPDKVSDILGKGVEILKPIIDEAGHLIKFTVKTAAGKVLKLGGKLVPDIATQHQSLAFKSAKFTFRLGSAKMFIRLIINSFESQGSLDYGIHSVNDKNGEGAKKAYVKANKINMKANARLQIGTTFGNDSSARIFQKFPIIPEVSASDLVVPGIANIGPTFGAFFKIGMGSVEATGEIYLPLKASIPEDAVIELDLSGNTDDIVHYESWVPDLELNGDAALTFRLCTDITAKIHMTLDLQIGLKIVDVSAFKVGVAIGPYITERFEAIASTSEGCNKDDTPNKIFSLTATTVAGIEMRPVLKVLEKSVMDSMWSPWEQKLGYYCFQFGPDNLGNRLKTGNDNKTESEEKSDGRLTLPSQIVKPPESEDDTPLCGHSKESGKENSPACRDGHFSSNKTEAHTRSWDQKEL
ncbi:hypothetical protein E2P81_ATG02350 [Venturia nashicola]|nr:hypothetical protein E2P81_ATG02350 [Venturia nashicola]